MADQVTCPNCGRPSVSRRPIVAGQTSGLMLSRCTTCGHEWTQREQPAAVPAASQDETVRGKQSIESMGFWERGFFNAVYGIIWVVRLGPAIGVGLLIQFLRSGELWPGWELRMLILVFAAVMTAAAIGFCRTHPERPNKGLSWLLVLLAPISAGLFVYATLLNTTTSGRCFR